MRKSTIADIARRAGVSTATVDRALNDRGGVSASNRQRVFSAARGLGYLATEDRVALPSRPAHLEYFIPFSHNEFMRSLGTSIAEFAAILPLVASCTIHPVDGLSPEALVSALERTTLRTSGVGLITIDHPVTRNAIRRLTEAGVRVITIATDVLSSPRSAYVGVDNRVAGRTAGLLMGRMSGGRPGSVSLFLGSRAFHGHEEREFGFRAVIGEQFPHLRLLDAAETGEDNMRSHQAADRLLADCADLAGIYCVGAGRSGIARALRAHRGPRPLVIFHDLTDNTRGFLAEGLIDVVIDQNVRLVAEQAVIQLLGSIASAAPFLSIRYIEPRLILRENIPVR